MSLAALAAVVGCSKVEEHSINVETNQDISLVASIEIEDTRVTVAGEKFTEVSWEQGDVIRLASVAGVDAELAAEAAGSSNIRFVGESSLLQDVDTYYAVYPSTNIEGTTVTFNYAEQSGDDVAALVAKSVDAPMTGIEMAFKPVNSLLHVAVSGVESLAKAEFVSFNGTTLPAEFSYNFESDTTENGGSVEAYTVTAPAVEGFFFRLPADLDMSEGYIVRLTDAQGNICSKAYNGKTFARGTTTRVEIAWTEPIITFGTPMTSYSYYLAGDVAKANSCTNNVIYVSASTYANLQSAMVAEAGFIVDGTTYPATIDTATKSFSGEVAVSSWGEKSVEIYVKTKDGRTYKSDAQTVHITGLPYSFKFYQSSDDSVDAAGWKRNGKSSMKMELMTLQEGGAAGSDSGWVASPKYYAPAGISTTATIQAKYYVAALSPSGKKATLYVGATTSNTSSSSSSQSKVLSGSNNTDSSQNWTTLNVDLSIPAGEQYVSINHNGATYWSGSRIYLCNFELKYK